jgi:peptide/nickel transport system permease protein
METNTQEKRKSSVTVFFQDLFRKKPLGALGMIILILLVLVAVFADYLAPYPMVNGALPVDVLNKFAKSSAEHLLGCDSLGRDVLSYLIYGTRTSVILCVCCSCLSILVSIVIGTLSALIGGWFDLVIQRFVDAWLSIPAMLILLILMSILGSGMPQLIFALSVPSGIAGSRLIRSAAISVRSSGYLKVSEMLGSGMLWRMIKHVIPNILPLIITNMATSLSSVVLMESSLSFLGFGVDPATPSWGYMITNQGRTYMYLAPWLAVYPGICISIMVFSANMFGDAVRDLLDPRLKGGVGSYSTKKIAKIAAKQLRKVQKDMGQPAEAIGQKS